MALWRSSVCCLLLLLAGIWILTFFNKFSLFYRHKVIFYLSTTLHNKTKILRMFDAIRRRSNNRENCLILMLRQNATQEAFLAIRNNARQLWWLHYQTPSTFHQVLTTQISGLGQSGKWAGSRDPDKEKNVRRDYYNFVYFTPDEMHLNTSLWYLLFLQDTIIKIF